MHYQISKMIGNFYDSSCFLILSKIKSGPMAWKPGQLVGYNCNIFCLVDQLQICRTSSINIHLESPVSDTILIKPKHTRDCFYQSRILLRRQFWHISAINSVSFIQVGNKYVENANISRILRNTSTTQLKTEGCQSRKLIFKRSIDILVPKECLK